ncbi:hypothetical protein HK102_002326 [Quaeritorhiza haematococci]|nr:hypothetical protein HK102_002326 [Quaeritorhiza haematococci]
MKILSGLLQVNKYALNAEALRVLAEFAHHGGNQQRFTIAKWFFKPLQLIVVDQRRHFSEEMHTTALHSFTHVMDACFDPNAKFRSEIVKLTKSMDIEKTIEVFIAACSHRDKELRTHAFSSFTTLALKVGLKKILKNETALDTLVGYLRNPDLDLRLQSFNTLLFLHGDSNHCLSGVPYLHDPSPVGAKVPTNPVEFLSYRIRHPSFPRYGDHRPSDSIRLGILRIAAYSSIRRAWPKTEGALPTHGCVADMTFALRKAEEFVRMAPLDEFDLRDLITTWIWLTLLEKVEQQLKEADAIASSLYQETVEHDYRATVNLILKNKSSLAKWTKRFQDEWKEPEDDKYSQIIDGDFCEQGHDHDGEEEQFGADGVTDSGHDHAHSTSHK